MRALHPRRILLALLIAALVTMGWASAVAESSFQAEVVADGMRVYSRKAPYSYAGTLPKGTVVTVNAWSGKAALITWNGQTGIAAVADMKRVQAQTSSQSQTADTQTWTSVSKQVVTTQATKVYGAPSASSQSVSVPAGTEMTLVAVSGTMAKVQRGGAVGYTLMAHLGEAASDDATRETTPSTQTTQTTRVGVYAAKDTRVYQQPSTSSGYTSISKGASLTLLAVKGSCAMVEYAGSVGYTYKDHLTTQAPVVQDAYSTGSNESIIFKFMVNEMGYNAAAACGVVANMKYESDYNPHCVGDSGTSYGIAQWHAGRKTRLISWCSANGYDYTTLKGQLYYLKYDLTTNYPAVNSYLKKVENSGHGAYDAGYYFCYHFEAPASRVSQSVKRGNYAENTLYAKYK